MRVSRAIRMESRTARASSAVSKDSWAPCLKRVRCRRAEPPGPLPKQSGNADPLLVRRLWTSGQSRKGLTLTHGRGLTAATRCVHSGDRDRSHRSATAASTGSLSQQHRWTGPIADCPQSRIVRRGVMQMDT